MTRIVCNCELSITPFSIKKNYKITSPMVKIFSSQV